MSIEIVVAINKEDVLKLRQDHPFSKEEARFPRSDFL